MWACGRMFDLYQAVTGESPVHLAPCLPYISPLVSRTSRPLSPVQVAACLPYKEPHASCTSTSSRMPPVQVQVAPCPILSPGWHLSGGVESGGCDGVVQAAQGGGIRSATSRPSVYKPLHKCHMTSAISAKIGARDLSNCKVK